MIDLNILILAIRAYFLLNALLMVMAMIFSFYIRHRDGLYLMIFPDENMSYNEKIKDFEEFLISLCVCIFAFIPLITMVAAYGIAGQMKIKKPNRRKKKWLNKYFMEQALQLS